jgi:hypothetical protein
VTLKYSFLGQENEKKKIQNKLNRKKTGMEKQHARNSKVNVEVVVSANVRN